MALHFSKLSISGGPHTLLGGALPSLGCSCFCPRAPPLQCRRKSGFQPVQAGAKPDSDEKPSPISFGDRLLDYIEGGPKLRKWYGAPEQLPKDGGASEQDASSADKQDELEIEGQRDAVLVTDADSDTGQLVVLSLILKRARVRALVKDVRAATIAFGSYVEPVIGDVNDKLSLKNALRGVKAIICPSKVGALGDPELLKGVEHIVYLSQLSVFRDNEGFGSFFTQGSRYQVEKDEATIARLGIPHTIVRAGSLRDEPGGRLGFNVGQGGKVSGSISREDAANVCVRALDAPPQDGLLFEVANGEQEISDWQALFDSLTETPVLSG